MFESISPAKGLSLALLIVVLFFFGLLVDKDSYLDIIIPAESISGGQFGSSPSGVSRIVRETRRYRTAYEGLYTQFRSANEYIGYLESELTYRSSRLEVVNQETRDINLKVSVLNERSKNHKYILSR